MEKISDIRRGRHCVFLLHAHLAFVTKYRHGVFTKAILDDLKEIFASVCRDFEAELVEFDGEDDHVHLLVVYPPKVAISSLVNSLKGASSRVIRKKGYPCDSEKTLGRLSMVAKLFCRKLRRSVHLYTAPVYCITKDAGLKTKIPVKARLISSRLPGEVLRALDKFFVALSCASRRGLSAYILAGHATQRGGISSLPCSGCGGSWRGNRHE